MTSHVLDVLIHLTDFFLIVTYYRPSFTYHWIYRLMHRTDLFIVSCANLKYTKQILLKCHAEWCCIGIYIRKKPQKLKTKWKKKKKMKLARLSDKTNSWMECIQSSIHVYLFLDVKLCKFYVLHNPSSSQHYDRPHYSFRCNIESKHFTREYAHTFN